MLKQMKKMLNIPLVKSYKFNYDDGIYIIENSSKTKSVEPSTSRLFKSIREINIIKNTIDFNIEKVKLKPIHVCLLAKGLRSRYYIKVRI